MTDPTNIPPEQASAEPPSTDLTRLDSCDPVIEAFKRDVDRTLLRENLKLTVEERLRKFERFMNAILELRGQNKPCSGPPGAARASTRRDTAGSSSSGGA